MRAYASAPDLTKDETLRLRGHFIINDFSKKRFFACIMSFCYKIKDKVYPTGPNTLIYLVPMPLHYISQRSFRLGHMVQAKT